MKSTALVACVCPIRLQPSLMPGNICPLLLPVPISIKIAYSQQIVKKHKIVDIIIIIFIQNAKLFNNKIEICKYLEKEKSLIWWRFCWVSVEKNE
jgi:hypothetical protein